MFLYMENNMYTQKLNAYVARLLIIEIEQKENDVLCLSVFKYDILKQMCNKFYYVFSCVLRDRFLLHLILSYFILFFVL